MTHHAGQHGLLLDAPRLERSSASAFRCSPPHATCDPAPSSVGPLLRGPPPQEQPLANANPASATGAH